MKKVYAIIVTIFILFVMAVSAGIVKAVVENYQNSHNLTETSFILVGLIKLLPFVIAFWLIKWSWAKITNSTTVNKNDSDFMNLTAEENHLKSVAIASLTSKGYKVIDKNNGIEISEPLGGITTIYSIDDLLQYTRSKNSNH